MTKSPGEQDDYQNAEGWLLKAAGSGNTTAMWVLGRLAYRKASWDRAHGGSQEYEEASKWLEQAAMNKNQAALCDLSEMLAYGDGVAQDEARARVLTNDLATLEEEDEDTWSQETSQSADNQVLTNNTPL